MRSVLQPDLSVTGSASSRHERPFSGYQRRHLGAERAGSTKAHIFGMSETPRQDSNSVTSEKSASVSTSYHSTPEAPRVHGQQTQNNTISKQAKDHWDQPVDVPVHSSPKGKGRRSAPVGVPQLSLGNLADDNNKLVQAISPEPPHFHTPDTSRSDVSWGSPVDGSPFGAGRNFKTRQSRFQEEKEAPVPRHSPAPASKRPAGMPALDLEASQEDGQAFMTARDRSNIAGKQLVSDPFSKIHDRSWNAEPGNEHQYMKQRARDEQEKLYSNKKKDFVVETVLVDQLSRAAISDPAAVGPENYSVNLGPKERKKKEFYNTRNIHSSGKSENLLAKRVRFGARLVTKNGHDIHRELNGFYFLADNTLTVYEFRQFGTRSSALPFIQRGSYSHIYGQKKGQTYNLQDIAVGNNLSFHTASQNSLPQSLNMKPVVTLRITDFDEEAKNRLLYEGCCSIDERRILSDKLNKPPSNQVIREKQVLESVQGEVRKQLKARAVKTLMGLGRHFRQLDKSGDGILDKQELLSALKMYRIQIPQQVFEDLWHLLDVNGDGALDYGEFIRGFIGEMNESRKAYIRKVFHRLDPSKAGVVELNTIKKFFSANKHPRVLSGEMKEAEITSAFIDSFANCENRGEVTYGEFEDYYEGISIAMDSDKEFIAMMKNCWGC